MRVVVSAGRRLAWMLAGAFALTLALAGDALADTQPFGVLSCTVREGVRWCPGSVATRIPSFDKVPLDVNVALPATGDSNLPLVVIMHGWGGQKPDFPEAKPWAQRGYAVLTYSARGFAGSCGTLPSRAADPANCPTGFIRLADSRYEIHDTQQLTGLLADQGLIDGQRIGVTGVSYAGGQSMALAVLRNRILNTDGTLSPWRSPGGKPMQIAAADPGIPWTDLVYSLLPNGRTLDYTVVPRTTNPATPGTDLNPPGVMKESFVSGLFATGVFKVPDPTKPTSADPSGVINGYYAPPGTPGADLNGWYARVNSGEPYSDPEAQSILTEIAQNHSSYYLNSDPPPAPLFISNGWTDDLFPVDEALRFYNFERASHPEAPIALMFFDWGHQRGQNKAADVARLHDAQFAWFDRYVKGDTSVTPPSGVETLTQTCPKSAPSGGPYFAPTWAALHPGEIRLQSAAAQTFTSAGGDPQVGKSVDPILVGGSCATASGGDEQNTANWTLPPATGSGYTLMGAPTVIAKLAVTTADPHSAEIAARLWDVAPGGGQTLIARALYRPEAGGTQVFQLHANGWHFAAGHSPKLQLLGRDAPYARPSNEPFQVSVSDMDFRIPVWERPPASNPFRPSTASEVGVPAPLFVPTGQTLAVDQVRASLRVRYRRAHGRRPSCHWSSARVDVTGSGLGAIRRVDFRVGRRLVARDYRRAFQATVRPASVRRAHSRRLAAQLILRDGRRLALTRTLRRC